MRSWLVPRTRSSQDFSTTTVASFRFKSGTGVIESLVSFSIAKFAQRSRRMLANFGIGTLAAFAVIAAWALLLPIGAAAQQPQMQATPNDSLLTTFYQDPR